MKKMGTKLLIAFITGVFLFSGTIVLAADKIKVGVSVPSADHGWTAGLLWWAKKAVKNIEATDKEVTFYVMAASSGSKQVGDVEDLMVKGILFSRICLLTKVYADALSVDNRSVRNRGWSTDKNCFRHALKWTFAGIVPRCFAVI